jgi:pimeloyl-ACP methyl ester carboxylesterase
MFPSESAWIRTQPGRRLHYRRWGAGKRGCILLHGHGEGSYVWKHLASCLNGFVILAPDLPGHGDSDWYPDGKYDLSGYIRDVGIFMDAFELDTIRLVGHSLGANVAMRIAAGDRRIEKLVLVDFGPGIDSGIRRPTRDRFKEQFRRYDHLSEYEGWLSSTRPLLSPRVVADVALSVLRQRADGPFEMKCDPLLSWDHNNVVSSDCEILSVLRQIRCPTLVVRGAGSAVLSPSATTRMLKWLGTARACTVAKAGHAVMLDNPEEFASVVKTFVESE